MRVVQFGGGPPRLPVPPGALAGLLGGLALGGFAWAGVRAGVPGAVRARPASSAAAAVLSAMLLPAMPARAGGGGGGGGGGGSTAVRRFYVMDRLGSSLLVLAPSGTVAARRVFEPFGRVLGEDSTETTPRLFTGQAHQAETGFYDYGARWYDPAVGRYLAVDPVIGALADPQSHNGYGYVRNDPVNRVDPSGLFGVGAISGGVGIRGSFGESGSYGGPGSAQYEVGRASQTLGMAITFTGIS